MVSYAYGKYLSFSQRKRRGMGQSIPKSPKGNKRFADKQSLKGRDQSGLRTINPGMTTSGQSQPLKPKIWLK
jgi:hypothetical protein